METLLTYDLYQNCIDLHLASGRTMRLYFNEWSGKIYKRPKIDPILKYFIDHKGLYIGADENGVHYIIHNHVSPGKAVLVTWDTFAAGEKVSLDNKTCTNHPTEMISIAFDKLLSCEPYDALSNSCQTLVNEACTNERKNDDTGRVVGGILLAFAAAAILDSIFRE